MTTVSVRIGDTPATVGQFRSLLRRGWYLPRLTKAPPRCVFEIANGRVYYGTGGLRKRECLDKTFRNWMRSTAAVRGRRQLKCQDLGMTPDSPIPE